MVGTKRVGEFAVFTRLVACRRGAVSLEAAILWPVMIALLLGVIEFALMFFTYGAMQTAAREVARQLAVNFTSPAQAAELIGARMPQWTGGASVIEVTQTNPGDAAANVIRVSVTLPAAEATPVRFFIRAVDPFDLRAEVVMKQEILL